MAQTYNPKYLGGRDQADHSSRPASTKSSLADPHLNQWQVMVVYTCHLNYEWKHK
jgi:hypothetical protein